jgi:pyruvyltransferase
MNLSKRLTKYLFYINNEAQIIKGTLNSNLVKTYWYINEANFGDLLTPELIKSFGFSPVYTDKASADLLFIGSILDNVPENYSGYIIGSGLISDQPKKLPNAIILAVRGKLTRERINASNSTILGDPGLLIDRLIKERKNKEYPLGIVPHYVDKLNPKLLQIANRYKNEILLIDVQHQPKQVIAEIDKCEFIISSSLHGLITADSLGIPNAWVSLSNKIKGGGFKFNDYASAMGMEFEPILFSGYETLNELIKKTHKPSAKIDQIKRELSEIIQVNKNNLILRKN